MSTHCNAAQCSEMISFDDDIGYASLAASHVTPSLTDVTSCDVDVDDLHCSRPDDTPGVSHDPTDVTYLLTAMT